MTCPSSSSSKLLLAVTGLENGGRDTRNGLFFRLRDKKVGIRELIRQNRSCNTLTQDTLQRAQFLSTTYNPDNLSSYRKSKGT